MASTTGDTEPAPADVVNICDCNVIEDAVDDTVWYIMSDVLPEFALVDTMPAIIAVGKGIGNVMVVNVSTVVDGPIVHWNIKPLGNFWYPDDAEILARENDNMSGICPVPVPTSFLAAVPKPTFKKMYMLPLRGMLSAFYEIKGHSGRLYQGVNK